MPQIKIADRVIGDGRPTFIIAEAGINHEGCLTKAKALVDAAKTAGADCVKFQKRSLKSLYSAATLRNMSSQEQGVQYIHRYIKRFELSDEDMHDIKKYCDDSDIMMSCTPFDEVSLELMEELDLPFIKVGSPTFNDVFLLQKIVDTGKPIIASTGMSTLPEILVSFNVLSNFRQAFNFALLHCVSSYPSEFGDLNLKFIETLRKRFKVPVGYSGHERGLAMSTAAVALGACIIERHLTLDRCTDNPDNRVSLEPQGFSKMVRDIRNLEGALGSKAKYLTRPEFQSREALSKSLVANQAILKGEIFKEGCFTAKCPGNGLPSRFHGMAYGKPSPRYISPGEQIQSTDVGFIDNLKSIEYPYKFGLIARFHDVDSFMWQRPKVVEFHLTDSDLNDHVLHKQYPFRFSFHMPEYFENNLIDIATDSPNDLNLSLDVINRAMDNAISASPYASTGKPRIVIHPGGAVMNKGSDRSKQFMNQLYKSIAELRRDDIDIFVENMPPFPIYFGGVWYQQIFMDPNEIIEFCEKTGLKICYDVSHAGLACNHFGWNIYKYTDTLAPYIGHIHIADYAGTGGEGLQIGEGECDWPKMMARLWKLYKRVPCLLEIWRGHMYGGYGFAKAMDKLSWMIK